MGDSLRLNKEKELRNVLVIAYYFPPMGLSGVQRTLKFVKYLPQNGWRPIVLTTSDSNHYAYDYSLNSDIPTEALVYTTGDPKPGGNLEADYSNEGHDNPIKIPKKYPSAWLQKLKRIISLTFLQPDSKKFWKKKALASAEKIFSEHKIDCIFASGPPYTSFLVARELSVKFNVPYVLDYRDLWVGNAYYYYPTPFHKKYAQKLEKLALTRAERITVINRDMKESILRRYDVVTHEDISILPHGFDAEDFSGVYGNIDTNFFTLTHSGLFPDDLTPKYFLKAVKKLLDENPEIASKLRLRFIGILRRGDQKLIKKLGLQDITVSTGYVPHSEAVRNIMESDVLWMMIPNNIATPSRLYEYIGSGKPLLVSAAHGAIRQLAEQSGAAVTTDPKDIEQIKDAILQLYVLWKNGKLPTIDESYRNNFERKSLTEQLSKELLLSLKY